MTNQAIRNINRFMKARPPWQVVLFGLVLLGAVAVLDHLTPPEISLSIFYIFPTMFVGWYVGKRAGYSMCIAAAFTMVLADYTSGQWLAHEQWISFWNAGVGACVYITLVYLVVKLKASLRHEQALARKDALTGVRNSFAFKEESNMFVKYANRHKQALTLGYVDLDGFKSVNDMMGHAAGDQALKAVGAVLSNSARGSDIVGRIGGDEFAILLSNTGLSGAKTFFNRLHSRLLDEMKDGRWPVGFSVGVAVFPDGPPEGKDVLSYADALMYKVKKGGKNSVIYKEFTGSRQNVRQSAPAAKRRRG